MSTQYRCANERRRQAVRDSAAINGIDYLEVAADQRTLHVHFFHDLPTGDDARLRESNLAVDGGVRIRNLRVESVSSAGSILTVQVSAAGDFSTYRLRVVSSPTNARPPSGFDAQLSEVAFSFRIDCPGEFDCGDGGQCLEPTLPAPTIDYLARDFSSLRRLMLDRLAVVMPAWQERHAADLGVALVEVLANAGDHLSYFQDAVATEAYLGTARRRVSIRRHARLLDYPMHDGANARTWVQLEVASGPDGIVLPRLDPLTGVRTRFLTRSNAPTVVADADLERVVAQERPEVFEPLHDARLYQAHNELRFYTWGDEECCLPAGATGATLRRLGRDGLVDRLAVGDVLLFEEARGPATGDEDDADPTHRHVVRLTAVEFGVDPLLPEGDDPAQGTRVVEIAWSADDALPFPLCLSTVVDGTLIADVSLARGNVVLADHGRTVVGEALPPIPVDRPYRPALARAPVTQQASVLDRAGRPVSFDPTTPARAALQWQIDSVLPAVELIEAGNESQPWRPQRDLLGSDRFATEMVVEVEEDGRAYLRFGVPPLGRAPVGDLTASYRVGNGLGGNIGAEAIAHVVSDLDGLLVVRNPLPAVGGLDPEPVEQVRLYAPQAFRTAERAVTEADYAAMAERHPEVQKAAATRRWTGSWYTMFVTVDRRGGRPVDADFEASLRDFLDRFRLAGYDVEIEGPLFVPLDVALSVCVAPGYFRANVKQALLEIFGAGTRPDGQPGFFAPDNFTFGQPVYLSQVVAAAMQVPGVAWVEVDRFQRWRERPHGELEAGRITFGRLEIARLDNDPNRPENGRFDLTMQGGL